VALQVGVFRLVYDTHPTAAELLSDLVVGYRLTFHAHPLMLELLGQY
jgi:hypothetical protein